MRVKLYVDVGVDCEHAREIIVSDDTSEDELNKMANKFMLEHVSYGFVVEKTPELSYDKITNALECCIKARGTSCQKCPLHHVSGGCTTYLMSQALKLVKNQRSEIDRQSRKDVNNQNKGV